MKDFFKVIFEHTLKWEGGSKLHNVKNDNGGITKYGLTYKNNQKYFRDLDDFKTMTFDKASEVAYNEYFKHLPIDYVPKEVLPMLFDMCFNMGYKRAIISSQRALNITDDGIVGKQTKEALKRLNKESLNNERVKFYHSVVKNNSTQSKFLNGWLNRADYFLKLKID